MRILVPVDGSDGSVAALEVALQLATLGGLDVTVLQVIEDEDPLPTYDDRPPPGVDRVGFLAERRFVRLQPMLDASTVNWTRRIEQGVARDRICGVAAEEHTGILVIGSRGLSAVGRVLLGSVSDYVARHAPCSVLIARQPPQAARVTPVP